MTYRFNMTQWVYNTLGFDQESAEEMLAAINSEEEAFMTDLVDSVGYLIKIFKNDFIPVFDQTVNPFLTQILSLPQSNSFIPSLQTNAICLYDDVVEHCGDSAQRYLDLAFPKMLEYSQSDNSLLRQASIYGIGRVVENFPEQSRPAIQTIIDRLVSIIQCENSKSEDNIDATENAVSALGRACVALGNRNFLQNVWLKNLPLRNDEEEAQYCHKLLCKLVAGDIVEAENQPKILGMSSKKENVGEVIRIFQEITKYMETQKGNEFAIEIIDSETKPTIQQLMLKLKQMY